MTRLTLIVWVMVCVLFSCQRSGNVESSSERSELSEPITTDSSQQAQEVRDASPSKTVETPQPVSQNDQNCPEKVWSKGVDIFSQNDVEKFRGITTIEGSLYVGPSEDQTVCDEIENPKNRPSGCESDVVNLEALSCVREVKQTLEILANSKLKSLAGLKGLTTIGRDLKLESNHELTDFDGLKSLRVVHGSIDINANFALKNVSGLSGLTKVGTYMRINNCDALPQCAVENLGEKLVSRGAIRKLTGYNNKRDGTCP